MTLRALDPDLPRARALRRTLVTGGCGFLGHHLVRRLLAQGGSVTVLDDLSTGERARLPRHPRLALVTGSVLDPAAVERAARGAERVVHLAAVVGMRLATRAPGRAYEVAVEGTRHVLAATEGLPATLVSSSAVYGRCACPASEDAPGLDATALEVDGGRPGYAVGKLEMEWLGEAARAAGRAVRVVRAFNVLGTGQSGAYGAVLPTFVRRALAGEPLRVHDDGRQTRSFSDVDTFLDCLGRLDARDPRAEAAAVVNVGSPHPTSIRALAEVVIEETESASPVEHVPYARAYPGYADVRARVPDVARLESVVGPVGWPDVRRLVRAVVSADRSSARRDGSSARRDGSSARRDRGSARHETARALRAAPTPWPAVDASHGHGPAPARRYSGRPSRT